MLLCPFTRSVLNIEQVLRNKRVEILNDGNKILEAILEMGDDSFIQQVYIGGKKVFELPPKFLPEEVTQRLPAESILFFLTFKEELLRKFETIKSNYNKEEIETAIHTFIDHLFVSNRYANSRFQTIREVFYKISWIAGVFYSDELPKKDRFINTFRISPYRNPSSFIRTRSYSELYQWLFGFEEEEIVIKGLYEEWAELEELYPIFHLFLHPPKEVSLEIKQSYAWLPQMVVFIRGEEGIPTQSFTQNNIPSLDIKGLISEEKLRALRQKALFIIKDIKDEKAIKNKLEEAIMSFAVESFKVNEENRIKEILEELSIILNKPEIKGIEPKKFFKTILLLMLFDEEWKFYYYFPAKVVPWDVILNNIFPLISRNKLA